MKRKIMMSAVLAFTAGCISNSAKADYTDTFIAMVTKGAKAAQLCRKGDLLSGTFSFRSFSGAPCKSQLIAAAAEVICPTAADDYAGSSCHTNALKALAGKDPQTVLKEEIAKMAPNAKTKFCDSASSIPLLAAQCTASKADATSEEASKPSKDASTKTDNDAKKESESASAKEEPSGASKPDALMSKLEAARKNLRGAKENATSSQ